MKIECGKVPKKSIFIDDRIRNFGCRNDSKIGDEGCEVINNNTKHLEKFYLRGK